MPREIDRNDLGRLIDRGEVQVAEVLPEEEYGWAHLPGAHHVPLKDLDRAAEALDPARPVVAYCHDLQCDMSPRAAAALERLGFDEALDYAAGKMDWLSYGLAYEGDADLVGRHLRPVPSCELDDAVPEVVGRLDEHGEDLAVVLDDGIVAGALVLDDLEDRAGTVRTAMRTGISTVRPSEERPALVHRMVEHAHIQRIVVTTSGGELLGRFDAEQP